MLDEAFASKIFPLVKEDVTCESAVFWNTLTRQHWRLASYLNRLSVRYKRLFAPRSLARSPSRSSAIGLRWPYATARRRWSVRPRPPPNGVARRRSEGRSQAATKTRPSQWRAPYCFKRPCYVQRPSERAKGCALRKIKLVSVVFLPTPRPRWPRTGFA